MTPKASSECIDIDEVISAIQNGLNKINDQLTNNEDTKEWTRQVLTEIGDLGEDHGCEVYTSVRKFKYGGWLYDLCWVQYSPKPEQYLIRMPLVLESEWGSWKDVCNDFEKLLLARAGLRVMVYGYDEDKKDGKNVCQKLKKYFETFESGMQGDRYLLCCWDNDEKSKEFHYHEFKVRLGRDVKIGRCGN